MTKQRGPFRNIIKVAKGWKVMAVGACATVLCAGAAGVGSQRQRRGWWLGLQRPE
jgi:hypothetical protein